ncbi:MAG TPA: gliding motility-associated C-terminal domain-containing protein [Saprospiraceae bacterium]|nr:gliding motility-associated C-terminal domain-containing protein [Saprospiraceae bacterium]
MTETITGNGPSPLCANGGVPHNISWFAFVAGGGTWTFNLDAFQCTGAGIQLGIYDSCDWDNEIWCDGSCTSNSVSLDSDLFVPGQTYWMFLDGCSGSVCSYEVTIEGNFIEPDLTPDDMCNNSDVGQTCDDLVICPGKNVQLEVTGAPENVIYTWSVTDANGSTSYETDENLLDLSFPDIGVYTACIDNISNGCPGQTYYGTICRQITVEPYPDELFMDQYVCTADFPYSGPQTEDPNMDGDLGWHGPAISTLDPDGFMTMYTATSANGCSYEQTVTVYELENVRGDVFISACGPVNYEFDINGTIYPVQINSSFNNLPYSFPGEAVNGCDSLINLTATVIDATAYLDFGVCIDGEVPITIKSLSTAPAIGTEGMEMEIVWKFNGEVIEGEDDFFVGVSEDGTYTACILIDYLGTHCEFTLDPIDVNVSDFLPDIPQPDDWATSICAGGGNVSLVIANTEDNVWYDWQVFGGTVTSGADSDSVVVSWNPNISNPEICVKANNICGSSPDSCTTFNIISPPTSDFMATDSTCIDSVFIVQYLGMDQPGNVYNWNFGNGDPVPPVNGPGPIQIYYSEAGDAVVSLSVQNGQCLSDTTTMTGTIVDELIIPTIDCSSNSSSITFTWPDVTGAGDYIASSLEGMGGTQTGNTYEILGLNAGDSVTIQLEIVDPGFCSNVFTTLTCYAQDCDNRTLTMSSPIDSICLDGNEAPFMISTSVSPDPGNGTLSYSGGTWVTSNGLFDPSISGPGVFTVSVTFTEPNNCKFTKTKKIYVFNLPANDIDVSKDTICINDNTNVTYSGGATGVSYDWDLGDATANSGSGGSYNLSWATTGDKTVSLIVEKNNCNSEEITKNVLVEPLIVAPTISCDHGLTWVSFDWGNVMNSDGYMVDVLVDGVPYFNGVITDNNYDLSGLTTGASVDISLEVISDNACPNVTVVANCKASACNDITLALDQIGPFCLDAATTAQPLTFDISGGNGDQDGVAVWSGDGVSNGVFDPNTAGAGLHTLYLDYTEDLICNQMDSMVVEVVQTPTAEFAIDQTICILDNATVTTMSTAGTTNYQWPAEANANDNGDGTYTLDFTQAGTYSISATATLAQCESSEVTHNITVEQELDTVTITCGQGDVDFVVFNWNTINCATDFEIFINGISIGTQSTTTYLVDNLHQDSVVNIEVLPLSDCACPGVATNKNCTAQNCPIVGITLMPENNNICLDGTESTFMIEPQFTNSDGSGQYVWSGTGVDANGMFNPTLAGPGSHVISLEYMEGTCPYNSEVTINLFEIPVVSTDFVNPNCYLDNTTDVMVLSSGGDGNYTYTVDGVSSTINGSVEFAVGTHTIDIIDGNGCSNSTSFTITKPSEPVNSISGPTSLLTSDEGTYTLNQNALAGITVDSIVWQIDGVTVCNSSSCTEITQNFEVGDHVINTTIYFNSGCYTSASLNVFVDEININVVTFPNIISPNNDTENNEWYISANEPIVINSVKIFDRWGSLMFTSDGPLIQLPGERVVTWDGTYGGKVLMPGVYVYMVSYGFIGDE